MRPKGLNNVVVVGAGSAGWMTALLIKKTLPHINITVIGSRELGILGAGEGTVPNIRAFLKAVELHPYDLLKRCKSTAKIGIQFVNWNGDNKHYHHGFARYVINRKTNRQLISDIPFKHHYVEFSCYADNESVNDYVYENICAQKLKLPFSKDRLSEYDFSNNAWHFDAVEIAKYFEEVGVSRGIRYIDDHITSFDQDKDGYVTRINMNKGSVDCDFVFDCSGFKRLIIGQLYNSDWVDLSKQLTVNRALPFFLPPEEKIKNYTTSTAMNSGWVWEIPLQHRTGCGYVFDSNFCDDETAKQELITKYGNQIDIPKAFSFSAGYYKQIWIKNCVAIGLSSGFVEPLEATSIWGSIFSITKLINFMMFFPRAPQYVIDQYNSGICSFNNGVAAFLQFHYMTRRKDTEFWRHITNQPYLQTHENFFSLLKHRPPLSDEALSSHPFGIDGYVAVGMGINFFNRQIIKENLNKYSDYFVGLDSSSKKAIKTKLHLDIEGNIDHQEFLELIVGKEQLEENRKLIFK